MVKFFDLDLSPRSICVRVASAIIFASLEGFLFYYLPTHLASLLSLYLPRNSSSNIQSMIAALVSPALPLTGIAISLIAFFGILLRGSKIYGIILVVDGILFSFYTYLFFQGGTMLVKIPSGLVQGISGSVAMDLTLVMWLLILPSLLTIVKGGVLLLHATRGRGGADHVISVTLSRHGESSGGTLDATIKSQAEGQSPEIN